MHSRVTASTAVFTLMVLQAAQPGAQAAVGIAASSAKPASSATLTLITGDRVVVGAQNAQSVSVLPATGRTGITFTVQHELFPSDGKMHTFVIPLDAAGLIAAGKLDRELFDVTTLTESGYDDVSRLNLPLIVTYERTPGVARALGNTSLGGAPVRYHFSSVNGDAVRAPKQQMGNLWNAIVAGTGAQAARATPGAAVRKVWLDRLAKPALDRSVPQIGAPAAWAAGYTGAGIVVGVIDTGIDSSHPDLAGKVIAQENFVSDFDPNVSDDVGHGTHVASIITGTGAASGGRFRGVAPDAQLVSAKACFAAGCPTSSIIAGMEWAVTEEGASVINMSLGGLDSNDVDPMEETVNELTAQYDVLFVVAAGNAGPGVHTVQSPSTAAAALSVAAVDRADTVASFSSRGPQLPGFNVKPEIAGPGVGIVAARASGTNLGTPVGDAYTTLSGTSMATPHVAGAAALLKQRYPQLSSVQLKELLMSSAKVTPTMGVYDYGAGRVDVAEAFASSVLAEPAALNMGVIPWPHQQDAPLTRNVTYTNLSNANVTLTLSVNATGPDGGVTPAGVFSANPATLVVPAGGTAVGVITVNTRVASAGIYTGRVIASSGSHTSVTPFAINVEPESYDLVVSHLNLDGTPALNYQTTFLPLDKSPLVVPQIQSSAFSPIVGDATVHLAAGRYRVQSLLGDAQSALFLDSFDLTGPQHLSLDERVAQPVTVLRPTSTAIVTSTETGFDMALSWGVGGRYRTGVLSGAGASDTLYFHSASSMPDVQSWISRQWIDGGDGSHSPEALLHAGTWVDHGSLPIGPTRAVDPKRVAVVDARYGYAESGVPLAGANVGMASSDPLFGSVLFIRFAQFPLQRTERYYSNDPATQWLHSSGTYLPNGTLSFPITGQWASGPERFDLRRPNFIRWVMPPFAPAYDEDRSVPIRQGNVLSLPAYIYSDPAGHEGGFGNRGPFGQDLTLFRNGEKVAESSGAGTINARVPADTATYRLQAAAVQSLSKFSTQVTAAWTFQSSHIDDTTSVGLPFITVGFQPALNASGYAPRATHFRLPLRVAEVLPTQAEDRRCRREAESSVLVPGSSSSCPDTVRSVTVRASFDDGANWTSLPVKREGRRWIAEIDHPANAEFVSLQATASDAAGNTFEETVVRAYGLADMSPGAARETAR